MKKKFRDTLRLGNMRNFSNNTIERFIVIDDNSSDNEKDQFVSKINERLWQSIQEVNILVKERILPYVIVRRVVREGNDKVRIIINGIGANTTYEELTGGTVSIDQLTHLINFKITSPQRQILVCDEMVPGNAKMIVDKEEQLSAAIDIFLDIAMFNSFSFLRELPHSDKRKFSSIKYSFFKEINEKSYYLFSDATPPSYYSFAFSARTTSTSINYEGYVNLWALFIEKNHSSFHHNMESILEQLSKYVDKENIESKYFTNNYWKKYSKGDYLLLRINKDPNNEAARNQVMQYFGITEFNIGEIKIAPTNHYYIPFVKRFIDELVVSAYKIVL